MTILKIKDVLIVQFYNRLGVYSQAAFLIFFFLFQTNENNVFLLTDEI